MTLSQRLRSQAEELEKLAASLRSAANGLDALGGGERQGNEITPSSLSTYNPHVQQAQPSVSDDVKLSLQTFPVPDSLSGLDLIASVLQEAREPVHIEHVVSKLKERGRSLGHNTVQSYLSRDKRFKNVSRGYWTLREFVAVTEQKEPQ